MNVSNKLKYDDGFYEHYIYDVSSLLTDSSF